MTDKEISAFHVRFCPFADRLYRSTLIVTGNPRSAEQLQVDVYLKAFVEYLHAGHLANFEIWLTEIAGECFADYEFQDSEMHFKMNTVHQAYHLTLKRLINCKQGKMTHLLRRYRYAKPLSKLQFDGAAT